MELGVAFFVIVSLTFCGGVVSEKVYYLKWAKPLDTRVVGAAGEDRILHCPAEGNPSPQFSWYKNNIPIHFGNNNNNPKYQLKRKNGQLTINGLIEPEDNGFYTCVALNMVGSLNNTILLEVVASLPNQRPVVPELGNQTAHEGATVTFSCTTHSGGVPQWDWFRVINGTDERIKVPRGTSKNIILRNVTFSDSGQYACNVSNVLGITRRSAWLTVLPSPERVVIKSETRHWPVVLVVFFVVTLMVVVTVCACQQKSRRRRKALVRLPAHHVDNEWYTSSDADSAALIPYDETYEFPRCNLQLGELLGEGAFGRVVKGYVLGLHGRMEPTVVAVKMLKDGVNQREVLDMVSEMDIMKTIGNHPNVVTFHGCCTQDGPLYLLVEFAAYGNLRHFLYDRRPNGPGLSPHYMQPVNVNDASQLVEHLSHAHLLSFCHQVARGMDYIASKNIVHRDLAARNVLVACNLVLKISDFGLTRDIGEAEYYKKTSRGLLPVKWMAPEALLDRKYTTKSDVWSYGVLLWEIFTYGGSPYPSIPVEQLHKLLSNGYRMDKPLNANDETYGVMQRCWHATPDQRPAFSELMEFFDKQLTNVVDVDYLSVTQSTPDIGVGVDDDVFDSPGAMRVGGKVSGDKNRSDSQYSSLSDYPITADTVSLDDSCANIDLTTDTLPPLPATGGIFAQDLPDDDDVVQGHDSYAQGRWYRHGNDTSSSNSLVSGSERRFNNNLQACCLDNSGSRNKLPQPPRQRDDSCLPPSVTDSIYLIGDGGLHDSPC